LIKPEFDPDIRLVETPNGAYLEISLDEAWSVEQVRNTVATDFLGKATIPNLPFEQADGTPISIDKDYLGNPRMIANPFPGPFEKPLGGRQRIKLWGANQD
jgi:alpha-N-arabinofuranosidase